MNNYSIRVENERDYTTVERKTLKKLCLDQENELAYVVKNGKILKYE